MVKLVVLIASLFPSVVWAAMQCLVGITTCVKTQGTQIPAKDIPAILENCAEFTQGGIGRQALRLSYKEINDRSGGRTTPLTRAWLAFGELHDSPLEFDRNTRAEETKY